MKGKRVQNFPENPCEYYGPIKGYTDDKLAVFFLNLMQEILTFLKEPKVYNL